MPLLWDGPPPYEVLTGHIAYPIAVHLSAILSGFAPRDADPEHKDVLEYASGISAVSHEWAHMVPDGSGVGIQVTRYKTPMSYPVTLIYYGIK